VISGRKMIKTVKSSALILVFVFASCSTKLPASDELAQSSPVLSRSQSKDEKYIVISEQYGFMLELPSSWEGKVEISEARDFVVSHKTVSESALAQNPIIFTIVEYGSREKWEQDSKKEGQPFPFKKLGEIGGKVYAYILPFDLPYDEKTPEDLKQYTEMMNEVEEVLKTFKAVVQNR
jgi:inhibitor of cysteine peptidase